jgi:hypothetical protein
MPRQAWRRARIRRRQLSIPVMAFLRVVGWFAESIGAYIPSDSQYDRINAHALNDGLTTPTTLNPIAVSR